MSLLLSRKTNRNRIKGPRRTHAQPRVEVLEGRALLSNLLVNGAFGTREHRVHNPISQYKYGGWLYSRA